MLMEGSTMREGKYSQNIRKAVDRGHEAVATQWIAGQPQLTQPKPAGTGTGTALVSCSSPAFTARKRIEASGRPREAPTKASSSAARPRPTRADGAMCPPAKVATSTRGRSPLRAMQPHSRLSQCGHRGAQRDYQQVGRLHEKVDDSERWRDLLAGPMAVSLPAGGERPPLTAAGGCLFVFQVSTSRPGQAVAEVLPEEHSVRQGSDGVRRRSTRTTTSPRPCMCWAMTAGKNFSRAKERHEVDSVPQNDVRPHQEPAAADVSWNGGYAGTVLATRST